MTFNTHDDSHDLSRYEVSSRREIISLLRNVSERNQLIRMQANRGVDSTVTSILEVDETDDTVIVDCSPSAVTNQRFLEADEISFETVLDNIRILFSASQIESCIFEERPALSIALPESVIRLQRRDFYRVLTPVASPVKCTIQVPGEAAGATIAAVVPLYNVSAGGIAITDEKQLIKPEIGSIYKNCRIDLPGGAITVTLRLKNVQEIKLSNGKEIRRLGFMFCDPPNSVVAAMQRYITKLERERNARSTGLD